ncbi:PCI-domain-containing protein [Dacryopinax primogenitus]|uniref:PCI-domain-containing protein n=1 Tax=Dacryopinax primogenitus (strain DJM 731) TaxID=1858805 RepID=M5G8T1_DACPD|nr:PCI-domain-containing protein [Dacryopinax primogenitus]EJU05144.1 PCI-domain-containing protein [Dacryopinax primogenitus]
MAEDNVLPIPNLKLPQAQFVLFSPKLQTLHGKALEDLMAGIQADEMSPYYKVLLESTPSLKRDDALLKKMEEANTAAMAKLDEALANAEKTEGETEISDALRAKATYLTRIGDKEGALEAQKLALEKTPGLGSRIDIVLTMIRIGFFFQDNRVISEWMTKASELVEQGGDWDRRNRLKVYQGRHMLSVRRFKEASDLLLDALSTFTATEVFEYNEFVTLTVLSGTLTLQRVDLKKRIISSPEVNSVLPELPHLGDYFTSLYNCDYARFFRALADVEQTYLIPSRILHPHTQYYVREMRVLAYSQLLQSYRSVSIASLSAAFGVTPAFIDADLSRFITSGRLNCTIDKVSGIVETHRPDRKNALYEQVVKQGDVVLNEIQKLSKVLY